MQESRSVRFSLGVMRLLHRPDGPSELHIYIYVYIIYGGKYVDNYIDRATADCRRS
jgi:hypothetical protein